MKVYHYSPDTYEFLGVSDADESPLEPGVYLIPANSTTSEPPKTVPAGKIVVFDGQTWHVKDKPTEAPAASEELTDDEKKAQCKALAKRLLQETDWTQGSDMTTRLQNVEEFATYRDEVRGIFFNPTTAPDWPALPAAQWAI